MKVSLFKLLLTFALLMGQYFASAQCTISSSGCGGYTVQVSITPTTIVTSSATCPFGYNYNVTFNYSITVSGSNTCWNGNIGIQPQIFCNSQNNGYYTINVPAPTVGVPSTNTYTGTLTTTTNPYNSNTDCASATPLSLNCNSTNITIYGPGISTTTVSCSTPINTISTGAISGSPLCAGAAVSVPFTAAGTYTSGNIFTAQLSNASGSFASPTNIGTLTSTSSGTISATIPGATATGAGYRIRVISSTPSITGTNNGSNLTINASVSPSVAISLTSGTNPACNGTSATFTATPTNGGAAPNYNFRINGISVQNSASNTYTTSGLVNGAIVDVILTSNANCAAPLTATSTGITMSINPILTPTISISSTQINLCTSGLLFTSSISNGGSSPSYQWKRNGSNISGANSATYNATNLVNGDFITCLLTSNATCASPALSTSNSITVNLTGATTTWLGFTSDWSVGSPINWDNGYPSSNVTAIIPSGTPNNPEINGSVACFNIEIQAGASLTINALNQLNVYGKFTNNGTFNAGFGSVDFLSCIGSTAQSHQITSTNGTTSTFFNVGLNDLTGLNLSTNANLIGTLTLSNGTFNNVSSEFTFLSTATGTARIAPVPATANYIGNITMQRFAPGPKTGWAQLGTSVQGANLSQWQDDFATSGYTGATGNAGGFISVYTYNEATPGLIDATGSYVPATNVTNGIPVGKGLWIYLGTAAVNTANITIDVTGQPTLGNFSFNPSYTNSGNPADDGFNMLANPYPSAIDWLSPNWTKTNVNNAIYMYQADNGQYASFVGGISTNGGSRFIASSQGFFIQTNGSSPVLNIQETAKTNSNPVLIKEEDPANVLRLKVNGDNVTDEMVIHLNESATENFDGSYDAKKIFSNDPSNPSISSINNNKDLSINCLPINGTSMSIPVRVTVGSNGMYNLSWTGVEGFTEGSCLVIEDLDNGNKTTLEKDGLYYFNTTVGFKAPRFIIHISTPLPKTVIEASCNNNHDGSITINNPSSTACDVQLKDINGNLIKEATINNTYTFDKLTKGTYQLSYPNATICGNMNQTINISAAKEVNALFDVSAREIETNAVVSFKTNISKSNNITWDFGDGTGATEATTVYHQYKDAGNYTVTMYNQNGECSAAETMVLNVINGADATSSMDIKLLNGVYYAVFNFAENTTINISFTNALGQEVAASQQFEGKNGKVKLPLDQIAEGIYIIMLNNGKESITRKIVK